MTQQELNDIEWRDQANWRGPFYLSPRDSRAFVPRRGAGPGVKANLAHAAGRTVLVAALLAAATSVAFAVHARSR